MGQDCRSEGDLAKRRPAQASQTEPDAGLRTAPTHPSLIALVQVLARAAAQAHAAQDNRQRDGDGDAEVAD